MSSDPSVGPVEPDKDEVVTPGGPRRRDLVEEVEPGETVRLNPDGSYTIEPKQAPPDPRAGAEEEARD